MAYSEPAATPETVNCRKTFNGSFRPSPSPRLPVEPGGLVRLRSVDLPHGELRVRSRDPVAQRVAQRVGDPGVDAGDAAEAAGEGVAPEVGAGVLHAFDEDLADHVAEDVELVGLLVGVVLLELLPELGGARPLRIGEAGQAEGLVEVPAGRRRPDVTADRQGEHILRLEA